MRSWVTPGVALMAASLLPAPGRDAAPGAGPGVASVQESGRDVESFRSGRASFTVRVGGVRVPYGAFFTTALPGQALRVRIVDREGAGVREDSAADFRATAGGGKISRTGRREWRWTAPPQSGGPHRVVIRRSAPPDSVVLNAFVLVPADSLRDGRLHGYRLGRYPRPAYRGLDQYRPPRGFIRLTRQNASTRVSPHFRLDQFPCKQPRRWPKYLLVGPKMVLKLELMLEELNRRGIDAPGFTVMSGYRSPWYNTELLNRPRYSRHIYGDAADVYVDADGDGSMDDLDGDGSVTIDDADLMYRMVDGMDRASATERLKGGLWKYPATSNHPPFVHVDTRGFLAR